MDSDKLSGFLTKVGLTWNTLLRLFYALCGWLVIGTFTPIGSTPIGVLHRLLDWLDVPSEFTLDMGRWCGSHSVLLTASGFGVILISIVLSCMVVESGDRVRGMEIPPFCFGLLLCLQAGVGLRSTVVLAIAWVACPISNQVRLSIQIWESCHRLAHLYEGFLADLAFTWPKAISIILVYPLLVLVRLFGGMPPNSV